MTKYDQYKYFLVSTPAENVLHIQLNRPAKLNAVHQNMYMEFQRLFLQADSDPDVRVIVLSGAGEAFCVGLDVTSVGGILLDGDERARQGIRTVNFIKQFQEAISSPHTINKPVIGVAHGFSIGLAIDILSAVDIRYASKDAILSIREADIGMAADIGTLQRLPKLVNNLGWLKDVAYTARNFAPDEALAQGLVSRVFDTKDQAVQGAIELAKVIASKSPVAIDGTKRSINYALDHSIADGLDQIATYNGFGLGTDLMLGAQAARSKDKPKYPSLYKL